MMIKFVNPKDHINPIPDRPVELIKVSSRGLTGSDFRQFEKRASIFDYEYILGKLKPGEVPIHVIALGCDEFYGPNRNGDAFTKKACREYHSTFVKYGRWFREHDHHDIRKSFGRVLDSKFNPNLGRIELIVALNGTKEAARKNGGRVATKELEALFSGKDIGVSMSCSVDYDVCSGCGKKSRSREEYCDEDLCKYGGCKNNLGKTFEDGHTLRVFNPEPLFFDISYVEEPADRIAYALGRIKSAALIPAWVFDDPETAKKQAHLLGVLAKKERERSALKEPVLFSISDSNFYKEASVLGPRSLAAASSSCGVVLSFKDFLRVFVGGNEEHLTKIANVVAPYLKDIFNRLLKSANVVDLLRHNPFIPNCEGEDYNIVAKLVGAKVKKAKVQKHIISKEDYKAEELAKTYALYQLGTLLGNPSEALAEQIVLMNLAQNSD